MKRSRQVMAVMVLVLGVLMAAGLGNAKGKKTVSGVVNINTASIAELMMLPGVGQSKAQSILDYRKEHPFQKAEDLKEVKGIGERLFASLQPYVSVSGPTTATSQSSPVAGGASSPQQPKSAPGNAGKAF